MHMYAKLIREGRAGFENMAEVHNTLSEDLSFRRVIRLAESVPGTALYMMHVSAATGVAAIAEARAKGLPIYGESLHQYMLHTAEDYKLPNGQIYHTYPSLKSAEDQKALWAGTRTGAINCVATDELCCTLREKTHGPAHRRHHGRQLRRRAAAGRHVHGDGGAARLFAAAVRRSRLHQRRQDHGPLSRARARSPSAAMPTSPSSIRRGAARCARRTCTRPTTRPWEGHDIFAWPVVTVLRGKVVVENGQFLGRERSRPVPQAQDSRREIIAGPML